MSTTRKPAPRLARPAARYRKGQAPKGAEAVVDSDSEEDEPVSDEGDVPIEGDQDFADEVIIQPKTPATRAINVALKDVNISTDGKVIISGRTAMEGTYLLLYFMAIL